jgi:sugar/nucleoside kinase (ribokinase family)
LIFSLKNMDRQSETSFPKYCFPEQLLSRKLDILALGSALLEQVIRVNKWPSPGGQASVNVEQMNYTVGGCAANVTCTAGRLGAQAAPITCVGDGRYGQEVWNEFDRSHVITRYVHRFPDHDGNLIIELTNEEGDWATLDYIESDVILRESDIPPLEAFFKTKVFHVDGFSYVNAGDQTTVEKAIQNARKANCLISVDGSVPAAQTRINFMTDLFNEADIVFANFYEAQAVTKKQVLEDVIKSLQRMGPKLAVVKLGKEGSVVITPQAVGHVPAFPVPVVDTVGAGDAYIATTLVRLIAGDTLQLAAYRGSAAGALACMGAGSLSSRFTLKEIDTLLQQSGEIL